MVWVGWIVWARGPFDRDYDYKLVAGKAYKDYGVEGMGMIAQHYFILRSGGKIRDLPYVLADYAALLPVTK